MAITSIQSQQTSVAKMKLCAGQECLDRDKCLRFKARGNQRWASFDIERLVFGGDCPAIETRGR